MRVWRDSNPQRKLPWAVFWNVYQAGHAGRPKQKSSWFATEAEAREFVQLTLEALKNDAPVQPVVETHWATDTLGAIAKEWLAEVEDQREASTHRGYKYLIDHYLAPPKGHKRYPALGTLVVRDATFTTKAVADYLKALYEEGVSLSLRRRLHRGLRAFCTWARFEGRLTHNPCAGIGVRIKRRGEEDEEPTPNPFTPGEIDLVFDQLAAADQQWLKYFRFLFEVGTRVGEAGALKWETVDLDKGTAHIEWSYDSVSGNDKRPKNHERRGVDLTDVVVELLREWRKVQRAEAFRRGRPVPVYVFTTMRLARMVPNGNMRRVFRRVMEACAITGHTPHDFRDTFAASHLATAWDRKLPWVSKQLGHKHVRTTDEHYFALKPSAATRGFANEIRGWR